MGDMNIDYRNKKMAHDLILLEKEFCLQQLIKTPTRVTEKTVIVHLYTNSLLIKSGGIVKTVISDHYPIYAILKKQHKIYEKVTFKCRKTKYLDLKELETELKNQDWDSFYKLEDVDKCWEEMYNTYIRVLDKLCPIVEYVNVKKRQEWISSHLFEMMKRLDHLFRTANATGDKNDIIRAMEQRNLTNEACSYAKNDYIKNKLKEDEGTPKHSGVTSNP